MVSSDSNSTLNYFYTGVVMDTTHNRVTHISIWLGLLAVLAMLLTLSIWPDYAEGHAATTTFPEVKASGALSNTQMVITPSLLANYLTATGHYTSYLPIIAQAPLPEPLNTLLTLINAERQRQGLPPLKINPILMQVAQAHTQNMVERGFFDHIDPATRMDACGRIASAGYALQACAENLAAGYSTAEGVFQAWMNSPSHRANLLSPNFTEIGIGYARGGQYHHYWTVDLARPQ